MKDGTAIKNLKLSNILTPKKENQIKVNNI